MKKTLNGVTEYCEGMPVELIKTTGAYTPETEMDEWPGHGRMVIKAKNEGGHNSTEVDLLELITWIKANHPELI